MAEKHKCPVCGKYEFEEWASYDICPVCGWEDDPIETKNPDYSGGANHITLNKAGKAYAKGENQIT